MTTAVRYTQNQLDIFQKLHFLCESTLKRDTVDCYKDSPALAILSNKVFYHEEISTHERLADLRAVLIDNGMIDENLQVPEDVKIVMQDSVETLPEEEFHTFLPGQIEQFSCNFRPGFRLTEEAAKKRRALYMKV